MPTRHDTLVNPPIEGLLHRTGSKFRLVSVASQRARQINAYFGHLGDGLGSMVPPQVTSLARKPLSIAFEEIDADKIVGIDGAEARAAEEAALADIAAAEAAAAADAGED